MIIKRIRNKYSFWSKLALLKSILYTKLFFPKQRIIRSGFVVRGKRMIKFGLNLTTGVGCRLEAFIADENSNVKLLLGDNIQLNDYVHISALNHVEIGDDVLIASHVYISDNSHGYYGGDTIDTSPYILPIKRPYFVAAVKIGNRVWLGEGVIIMPGVTIGEGAIIGAHSIVNKNVPANSIAVGAPVRIIKYWDENSRKWIKCN